MNKKPERFHFPLSDAMNSNSEMTKRLKYTKGILTHLLKNNNVKQIQNGDGGEQNIDNDINPPHNLGQNNGNNKQKGNPTQGNEFRKSKNRVSDPLKNILQNEIVSQKTLSEKTKLIQIHKIQM